MSHDASDRPPARGRPLPPSPSAAAAAKAQARQRRRPTLRGEAPTETIPMLGSLRGTPYRDPRVTRAVAEEHATAEVLELALRVGELMLRSGAGAPAVEAATTAVAVAGGLTDMDVDLTLQSLHMQARTSSGQSITRLRVVRSPRMDFARLAAVHSLVDDLVSGEIDTDEAASRLRQIRRTPRTWSRWMVTLAQGLVAAGVATSLGAGGVGVLVSIVSALVVDQVIRAVARINLPDFYVGGLGGAVATVVAFVAYVLGRQDWLPMSPSDFAFVVAGGIVALLPARTITSAMEDIIGGYPVTGTARLFAVLLHSFGLIAGVAAGLGLCLQGAALAGLDLSPPPINKLAWATASPQMVLVGSAMVGVAGAITLQSRRRMLVPSALIGVLAVSTAAVLVSNGVGRITATGIAAAVMAFVARLVALRMDAPPMTLSVPASFGLMPGLSIFVGLYQLSVPDTEAIIPTAQTGWVSVLTALGVIVAIATGSTLGEVLAAPLDSPVNQRRRVAAAKERSGGTSATRGPTS